MSLGVEGGGSGSQISNACSSTDPGRGVLAASTKASKPAWVSPMVNSRQHRWSPSKQCYPPLRSQEVTQPPEPVERAGRRSHQPARRPLEQVDTAINDIRTVSEMGFVPAPTEAFDSRRDMWRMRPAGQGKKSQGRPGRGVGLKHDLDGGIAVSLTPPAVLPEDIDVSMTPLVGDVGSVLPDVVSPIVAAGAPLADCWGGVSSRPCWDGVPGMAFPAVAGVASLAVVEVASSTDLMVVAGSPSMCSSQCACDWLVSDDYVKESDDVVFPGSSELGDPTVVIPPVVGVDMSVAKDCNRGRDMNCIRGRASVDVFPKDQELPRENNEAIVVGAVGSGAPWFLHGWAEGTEVEFMIDTGCQVTILATSVCLGPPGSVPASFMWTMFDIGGFVSFDSVGRTGYNCCFSRTEMRYGVG